MILKLNLLKPFYLAVMKTDNNKRILIWLIIILVGTNLSTIGSFYYHRISEMKTVNVRDVEKSSVPGEQRTRFFREQLNLNSTQMDRVREINREFNRKAREIEANLAALRIQIVDELGSTTTDSIKLERLANEIGDNHRRLKQLTSTFYLDLKNECTLEQQQKLHEIFQSMLNNENQVNLPQPGYQRGRGRNR